MTEYTSCLNFSFQKSDFRCGFCLFGCFITFYNMLVLFLMFGLGLKVLGRSFHCKSLIQFLCEFRRKRDDPRNGFYLASVLSFRNVLYRGGGGGGGGGGHEEDREENVIELRKVIKIEQGRANDAYLELEKERMAAADAAEEAMAMILRLQNEKSLIEMQARQQHKLAEQKQLYDQEVIQSLRRIIMRHESERSVLEEQLKLCRQGPKHYLKYDDEGDHQMDEGDQNLTCSYSIFEDDLADVLISSLEMDSSLL